MFPTTYARISTAALLHNVATLREAVGPAVQLWPAVKANAYGHGLRLVLDVLAQSGQVAGVSVANLEEAVYVRQQNWDARVLILGVDVNVGSPHSRHAKLAACLDYGVEPTLTEIAVADELGRLAADRGLAGAVVHLKIDTGMHRLGLLADEAVRLAHHVRAHPHLRLGSVYTHLAMADDEGADADASNAAQFARYDRVCQAIEADGKGPLLRHAVNSAGLLRYPHARHGVVRPGISLYGLSPFGPASGLFPHRAFRPIMRVVSRVVMLKRVPTGGGVGYGHTYKADDERLLAAIPIGYNDGYRRCWSGRSAMRVGPHTCPVVGRISMDSTMIDVTDVPDVAVGDSVEVISDDPAAPNSVAALARLADTIPYEVTCLLGARVHRVAVD